MGTSSTIGPTLGAFGDSETASAAGWIRPANAEPYEVAGRYQARVIKNPSRFDKIISDLTSLFEFLTVIRWPYGMPGLKSEQAGQRYVNMAENVL
jgi:hypothetical protein